MDTEETRYSLDTVKQDIHSFFIDDNHWAYQYGSKAAYCNKNTVFYKKQIQVIFEEKYPHDVTGKAVNTLIYDKFLKEEPRVFGKNMHAIFVCKRSLRYVANMIKEKMSVIERFSEDEVNDEAGKYAEILFNHLFTKNQFTVVGRNTSKFKNKVWTRSEKDLDFILERNGIYYGVEIKNTFDYMPQDEFEEKLEMCKYLGLLPIFPVRCSSPQQFTFMQGYNGLALKFKTRLFPPGNQKLVTDIWNHFRLPVGIWDIITPRIESIFLNYHKRNINE